jgi:DNA repair protein RecO (recombination protein O)
MSITKTEAIVLKSMKFGDTSRIATLYTSDHGKIKVIAKGIRKPKSRLAGALQTFSHIQIVFYKKRTTEIYLLSQADTIESHQFLYKDLYRYVFASAVLELLDQLVTGEEANPKLFQLALSVLSLLESSSPDSMEKLFCSYALRLAEFLGYRPKFDRCVGCNHKVDARMVLFSPEKGGIVCRKCAAQNQAYLRLSGDAVSSALKLQSVKTEDLNAYNIPKGHLRDILKMILSLLDYHTERGKELKSLDLLDTDKNLT